MVTGAVGAAANAADEWFLLDFQVAGGAWECRPLSSCGGAPTDHEAYIHAAVYPDAIALAAAELNPHPAGPE
jgi:hypothetical protein